MAEAHNKDLTQGKIVLSQDQKDFARQCASAGIASYDDVVRAYQSNDTTSLQKWQGMIGSTSTQREKASPGT